MTDPADDGTDPPTASSPDQPVAAPRSRPVPTVGVWVGPADEPARYERLEAVGGGAEGTIHRARFVGRGGEPRPVALKQYRPSAGSAADWPFDGTWHQIRDQAWMLAGLPRSAHIVRVREVFLGAVSTDGTTRFDTPFVAMEWVEGARPDVLLAAGPVPLDVRLGWVGDLAEAVDLLHSTSRTDDTPLVHGDIKPANCLVSDERGLVLVDTGAVARADGVSDHRGLHTPPYAAPEVLSGPGRRRTPAADLYSLGAVAFYLLTGERPPDPAEPGLPRVVSTVVRRTGDLPSGSRAAVAEHLLRLLDLDPARRATASAAAWAQELRRLARPAPRRRRTVALAGGLAAVALAAALTVSTVVDTGAGDGPTTVAWADLSELTAAGGAPLYEQTFAQPSPDWPAAATGAYEAAPTATGYAVHVPGRGVEAALPAPPADSVSDELVSATAAVVSGQGGWGVWCRGVDPEGTRRYRFLVSHTGAVQIADPDGQGTGWIAVIGLDLARPLTLTGRCADVPGAPVELTLAVNGRVVLTHRPAAVLGPGHAGVEAMTFADVEGPTVTAEIHRFDIRRPA